MLSHELKELIQKYQVYKKRHRKKWIVLGLLSLVLLLAILPLFQSETSKEKSKTNLSASTKESQKVVEKGDLNKSVVSSNEEQNRTNEEENSTAKIEEEQSAKKHKRSDRQAVTTQNSLKELKDHYNKHKTYSSAMAVSRYLYSNKEYKEAIKWAIVASKIDQLKVEPWLIYAKSQKGLGNITKAKKALEILLRQKESDEARALLKALQSQKN